MAQACSYGSSAPTSSWQFCAKPMPPGGALKSSGSTKHAPVIAALALSVAPAIAASRAPVSQPVPFKRPFRHLDQALILAFLNLANPFASPFWHEAAGPVSGAAEASRGAAT